MPSTLDALNAASAAEFAAALDGVYENSPWIAEGAAGRRPFVSLAQLKQALVQVVRNAGDEQQRSLLAAHPELAASAAAPLTAASAAEQRQAGLAGCNADEAQALRRLNTAYRERFGFPFVLAVRGPRGTGLTPAQILATLQRRLDHPPTLELAEALRQVHRIAELRLDERFGAAPLRGQQVWDRAEALAAHSDAQGQLTVTYLGAAHRACAHQLAQWMHESGFDEVSHDAVGNVVGVYHGRESDAPRLLTGSHYDTVRNGGRYDGRLGILVPMAAVQALHARGERLACAVELVAFAEEEGQRWHTAFLASSAVVGRFDSGWLDQSDAAGTTLRQAMADAGLAPEGIAALRRDPARYLGFVEVHIEQGPVLAGLDLPLGVVTSINGGVRFHGEIAGLASHAGTTPMGERHDAACAAAELVLAVERRASAVPGIVGTVGQLEVPNGSVNVVPGRCRFSLDIRGEHDALRDACIDDVRAELQRGVERRGLRVSLEETMRVAAAPCHPEWQQRWADAVAALGLPVHRLPSGAGHDAMMLHRLMPQAMLFVRGFNGGISHNPLETITTHDAELAVAAFEHLLARLGKAAP